MEGGEEIILSSALLPLGSALGWWAVKTFVRRLDGSLRLRVNSDKQVRLTNSGRGKVVVRPKGGRSGW